MKIFKSIICLFKGHDVDPEESIVADVMRDKRNWLCQCHRCGLYEMHDGAISMQSVTLTKAQAERTAMDFRREAMMVLNARREQAEGEVARHGEWEWHMSFGICQNCGYEYNWKGTDAKNYCPNCGEKKDG